MKNIKNKKRKPFLFIGLGLVIATFVFAGMQEGIQVVFRAKAVNKAGISEPSDKSEPVLFKD